MHTHTQSDHSHPKTTGAIKMKFDIIRPADIVVDGLMFYHGFFLLSVFRQLLAELAGWNPWLEVSVI